MIKLNPDLFTHFDRKNMYEIINIESVSTAIICRLSDQNGWKNCLFINRDLCIAG